MTDNIGALCKRLAATPANSPSGFMVKMRALEWCYPDSTAAEVLLNQMEDDGEHTSVRLMASALRDALSFLEGAPA